MNHALAIICHHCKQLDRSDKSGKPPCKASGRHFIEHVESQTCPRLLFAPGWTPAEIPVDYQVEKATDGRCCS